MFAFSDVVADDELSQTVEGNVPLLVRLIGSRVSIMDESECEVGFDGFVELTECVG